MRTADIPAEIVGIKVLDRFVAERIREHGVNVQNGSV